VLGAIGVIASRTLVNLVSFAVVWSMGSLLVVVALFDARGLSAALYYTLHSTLIAGALFLLAEMIALRRGAARDLLVPAPPVLGAAVLGAMFFVAGIAMAGLPPLSGFAGKLLILEASRTAPAASWIWGIVLATTLVVVLGFARAGTTLFWRAEAIEPSVAAPPPPYASLVPAAACAALIAGTLALSLFAGPVTRHLDAAAAQILDTPAYVAAVLSPAHTGAIALGMR
jgi:multicomponent K+:H+ antiporter subunit D